MLFDDVWRLCETHVFAAPSGEGLFNPYRDRHPEHDLPDGPAIRRENFRNYLACYVERPPVLFVAEAPGPWGCRFSGVPITSEAQLVDPTFPISGRPSGTAETPHAEYSANIYWRVVQPYFPRFFTWNSVPFHPHKPGDALSIRNPSNAEVRAWGGVLRALVDLLQPRHVLAVGRKAEHGLRHVGIDAVYVRHPSQGGARRFEEGVGTLFQAIGLAEGA